MGLTVTETAAQFVERALQSVEEQEQEADIQLRKVTVRLPESKIYLLDYIGRKLRLSRTGLAEELLVRAIEEAVCVVGLPPDEEEGFELALDMGGEKVA